MKRVVRIAGTAYCGSSLLCNLLDAQPGIRGMGELWHLTRRDSDAWCAEHQCPIGDCPVLSPLIGDGRFWEKLFDHYRDVDVLVDSSKTPDVLWRCMPPVPAGCRTQVILLSKMPHEFAYSSLKWEPGNWSECGHAMVSWLWAYESALESVQAGLSGRDSGNYSCPRLEAKDVCPATYRELALHPAATLRRICRELDLPFDEETIRRPFRTPTDTCTMGGNNAVYAQRIGNERFFRCEGEFASYAGGKYRGRQGEIFLDEEWRRDARLKQVMRIYYGLWPIRCAIDAIAARLGYPGRVDAFVEDLAAETGA